MSRRKLLIGASIAGHVVLFTGVFVHGVWDLDQLEYDSRFRPPLAVMTPPPAGGGAPSLPKVDMTRKPPKVVVKEPRQPRPRPLDELTITTEAPGTGTAGTGTGTGTGDGPETGEPCDEAVGPCGTVPVTLALPELPAPPEPPKIPEIVDLLPQRLMGMRIRGKTAIHPPRDVYDQMYRSGRHEATAVIGVCIATNGTVSSARLVTGTGYPAYDEVLVGAVRGWLYRPYAENGTPVPACSTVKFQYSMK